LLYRQAHEAAPAMVRAADGGAVPLAPRLRVALHLSLTLNEQHPAHQAAPASHTAARVPQAAAHSRTPETSRHPSAGAHAGPPLSFARAAAPARADPASGRQRPADARPGLRDDALPTIGWRRLRAPANEAYRDSLPLTRPDARLAGATARLAWGARSLGQRAPARVGPPDRANEKALRTSAAGSSGRVFQSSEPSSPPIPTRPRSDTVLVPAHRHPGGDAPLYLAAQPAGRTTAPDSFSPAWAPPPLVYRSAAPPPAPQPQPEARPAAAAAPSAPPVDLEAVSRDVISRIEKRLRVERERRGRS
jgi:hypothetical protein